MLSILDWRLIIRNLLKKLLAVSLLAAAFSFAGCVHVEIFHPDVEGTYHIGAARPFWSYEGQIRHIEVKTPIEPLAQETPSWCWAAATQMLLASQGVQMTQSEIVRVNYGDTREVGGKSPMMVDTLSTTFTDVRGKPVRLEAHRADGFPKNGLELVDSIEDGVPFIVDIGFYKSDKSPRGNAYAAHSLLVYGLTYKREGNNVKILSLDVMDPSYAIIRQTEPGYGPRQRLDAKGFDAIQGTLGVCRRP
jgi:hypothetical protein